MNRYAPTMPRAVFVVAALALAALTLGASIAPAREDARTHETPAMASVAIEQPIATEVAIVPARIEVVGAREPRTVFTAVKEFLTRKPQST